MQDSEGSIGDVDIIEYDPDQLFAGRYEVSKLLGRGGMGSVYLARDRMLDEELIALKILHPHYCKQDKHKSDFMNEVKIARRITHRNVVRTYDVSESGGLLYFTMEYSGAATLRKEYCGVPVDPRIAMNCIVQICKGLAAVHAENIIHRDLKPSNVVISEEGVFKISDFGIAQHEVLGLKDDTEEEGVAVGSALYMPPEVWYGDKITTATDFYALGVIAYELLTGKPPFVASTAAQLFYLHAEAKPTPPRQINEAIPPWLDRLILSMLAKEPFSRPQSTVELLTEIHQNLNDPIDEDDGDFTANEMQRAFNESKARHQDDDEDEPPAMLIDQLYDDEDAEPDFSWIFSALRTLGSGGLLVLLGYFIQGQLSFSQFDHWNEIGFAEPSWGEMFRLAPSIFLSYLLPLSLVLPLVVSPFLRVRRLATLWLVNTVLLAAIFVGIFGINSMKVGSKEIRENRDISFTRVQMVFEASIKNFIELAALMPTQTPYVSSANSSASEQKMVVNFKGGVIRSKSYSSDGMYSPDSAIVLYPTEEGALGSRLPLVLLSLVYMVCMIFATRRAIRLSEFIPVSTHGTLVIGVPLVLSWIGLSFLISSNADHLQELWEWGPLSYLFIEEAPYFALALWVVFFLSVAALHLSAARRKASE